MGFGENLIINQNRSCAKNIPLSSESLGQNSTGFVTGVPALYGNLLFVIIFQPEQVGWNNVYQSKTNHKIS